MIKPDRNDLIADILIQFVYDYKVEVNNSFSTAHDRINELIDNEQKTLDDAILLRVKKFLDLIQIPDSWANAE